MRLPDILAQNPLILHSLRNRRMDWRFIATALLALLAYCPACMVVLPYAASLAFLDETEALFNGLDEVGLSIFYMTMILLLIILTLFAPVLSVSAIAGERQRQTLDLLVITLIPAQSIVLGKLISTLIYLLLFLAAVWPLLLVCLVIGQVPLIEFMVATLLLLVTAVAFSAIGLFASARSKTITNATMFTYGIILPGLLIGPFLCMLPATLILGVGPTPAFEFIAVYGWGLATSLNPVTTAIYSAVLRAENGGIIFTTPPSNQDYPLIFPWVIYTIFYSFVVWLLIHLATRRLEDIDRR